MAIRNMMKSCSKWLLGKQSFKSLDSLVNSNQRPLTNIISNIRNEQFMSYGYGTKKLFTNDSKSVLYSFKSHQFPSNGNYQFPTIESRCLYSSSSINQPKKQSDKTKQPDNSKHQSKILSQKIPTRIKTVVHEDEVDKIVAAYSIAEEINLENLKNSFQKKGLYNLVPLPADAEALMFRAIYPIEENDREIFIFKKGSAVFWNFTATETEEIIKHIEVFSQNLEPVVEKEFLDYRFTQTPSKLVGERIELNEKTEHLNLEKYACSDALTQSVLLKAIEDSVQDLSVSMEEIAQNLKEGVKIRLTQREVLQQTGEIFVFRCKINLSADFLDTPDFYWERDNLESIYQSIYSHLIIGKRTRILNERIELCSDLTHLIHNKLTDKTHIKLEKYIIALILIEVAFETVHAFTRWLS